jgi:hypothetical protein
MSHPTEEQLLQFSDGELPGRASSRVDSHLKACWQCRTNLEEIEKTVGECVHYRTNVLQRHLPAPPAPWTDIYRSFEQIDATFDKPSLGHRVAKILGFPVRHARKWAPVAAALLLAWGLFYRYRVTPSVQAAELLHKAMIAAETHPAKPHRIQIRTKAHSFVRQSGVAQASASNSSAQELQSLFQHANYNWDDPLSAKSYAAWRDQLPSKQDQIVETQDSYRIRTSTGAGELTQATLQLRSPDLEPVEERLEFRNQEWVEITALPDETEPSVAPIASAAAPAPEPRATLPNPISPAAAAQEASIGDELQVLAALHQVGADLGDPIDVSRSGSEIVVAGVGITQTRREEIERAVSGLPRVTVRFTDSAPASRLPEQPAPANQAAGDNRQLQARITEQVGGRAHFEQLAAEVLEMSEPLMARVYALRGLEERFPANVQSRMNASDLESLRKIQRDHAVALRQQITAFDQVLKPVVGSRKATEPAFTSDSLQPATEELFQSARRMEKLLAVMFGAAPPDSVDEQQLPSQLAATLAQLRAKVEAYNRLVARSEK